MRIVILTAGGAGMFCGSCMHDNTWARALIDAGHDVTLLPTYTPIRVDEEDASGKQVFLGGINLYLEHKSWLWRKLPRWSTRWLDRPGVLRFASKLGVSNDAEKLGKLTLDMLAGESGPQKREIGELATFIAQLNPDAVVFSNALLVGALKHLRETYAGKIWCVFQGDDVYLEDLPEPYRSESKRVIADRCAQFDGYITHSDYYTRFISKYLDLPIERFAMIPLGIDLSGHTGTVKPAAETFTIGFFARICPEKGLHNLLAAARILAEEHRNRVRIKSAGYLGSRDKKYFKRLMREFRDLRSRWQHVGSPATHAEKVDVLRTFDVLSVPTDYHEPKGLPVLEALANGVPVVQPNHGAFPELLEKTAGGILVESGSTKALADALDTLIRDAERRQSLAEIGQRNVRTLFGTQPMVERTIEVLAGDV